MTDKREDHPGPWRLLWFHDKTRFGLGIELCEQCVVCGCSRRRIVQTMAGVDTKGSEEKT